MRILFALNDVNVGGSEVYTLNLVKYLIQKNHRIVISSTGGELTSILSKMGIKHYWVPTIYISSWFSRLFHDSRMRSRPLRTFILKFVWIPLIFLSILYSIVLLVYAIKKEKIDVVHCMQPGASFLGAILSKIIQVPFLVTVNAPRYIEFVDIGLNIGAKAKKIIAISEEVKSYLISRWKIDGRKVIVIPLSVGLHDLIECQTETSMDLSVTKKVVFVSGFFHSRVAIHLIEAVPLIVKEFPEIEFIIIGKGSPEIEMLKNRRVREINNKLGATHIKTVGIIKDRSLLMEYLDSADVVIATGLSAWEAIARRKPVVIAGAEGFDGILTHKNYGGLISRNLSGRLSGKKTSSKNIAKSIIELLKNYKLRSSINHLYEKLFVDSDVFPKLDTFEQVLYKAAEDS